ncbi:ParA family protein [Alkaliphilus oremlandii]|uniref:Sporulation initiation inhibitor protein Soj n=1 Tax=Alkaliphilus oremlandii (strain OhILAs) TaxID=350688 RepID=A8MI32_ALKOO|nr:ParA family protein [Alkaliphilus oremlandii]ABW19464.1 Cobyrinic acid ac-diamide synthase [Alkaliphilus oremlandii OhILAs]
MKNKIIAIVNQKGGVGKTTTTLNLGYALSQMGSKVLLIDFDPQGSLTVSLGYKADNKPGIQTIMADSIEEREIEKDCIIEVNENLHLIPANLQLAGIEMTLVNVMCKEQILRSALEYIKGDYDYILIDCSPSLGTLTINALAACDSIIIPVTPEFLSAKGLGDLTATIKKTKKRINPNIKIDGVLMTMLNERTNLSKEMIKTVNESASYIKDKFDLDMKIFHSKIPVSVKAGEAILNRKSIIEYDPKNKVSEAYQRFAKELILND